ncbi:unnamed protein product [Blepharisma stoltei]|uniref:WASH complex subunit 3 n=1 Tax=Blepharisma stoltei TaxID=1481888 RepID=A0AAU9KC21_9CILI|nr:unnamed protein product [Blepharisma stoltei]
MGEAIEPKKLIAVINAFAITTSEFLNHFCTEAHNKLSQVNHQIEKIEALTALLEYKLNSIPAEQLAPPPKPVEPGQPAQEEEQQPAKEVVPDNLKKYVRMVEVGVPRPAVKHKMAADGEDSSLLDKYLPPEA